MRNKVIEQFILQLKIKTQVTFFCFKNQVNFFYLLLNELNVL